jgi:predicted TIM-barrel fold metal-dependent hydrolase
MCKRPIIDAHVMLGEEILAAGPRIHALATANPWYGRRAIDELRRCHERGAVGLFLHPARQGFSPIEPIAAPLFDLAAAAQWPVMFHTGTFIFADVLAVAEAARRYPCTPMILGCGGFADMWFEIPGVLRDVPNLYVETSHTLGDGLRNVLNGVGHERLLFGSGEPSNRYKVVLKTLKRLELNDAAKRHVFHDNALRLFSLNERLS